MNFYAPDELPVAINDGFPVGLILLGETEYYQDFVNDLSVIFRVLVLVSKQDQPSELIKLLPFIETTGTSSILSILALNSDLWGEADDSQIIKNTGLGVTEWGGHKYISTEFLVKVLA